MDEKSSLLSVLYNKDKVDEWLEEGIRKIKYEDLQNAIKNNVYVDKLLFNHYSKYMNNPLLKPIIKMIFKSYWKTVESILTEKYKLYNILTENRPEFKALLDDPKSRIWLNMCRERGYISLYNWTWR